MGRFFRRRVNDRAWIRRLPDPFSLDDVIAVTGRDELRSALNWLYKGIEDGRIDPVQGTERIHYRFAGARRATDRFARGEPTAAG